MRKKLSAMPPYQVCDRLIVGDGSIKASGVKPRLEICGITSVSEDGTQRLLGVGVANCK